MTKKKLLDFQASISNVKQVNPLFSTCRVRILYTGRNRNMSIITRDAVEKALPTLSNIPIVGEYSEENKDYKGHGGAISLDDYKYIHTTKPYGVVPESATYEWEEVRGKDGATREYLTINGCYLWTGRYEEAFDVIQNGKGQSMEIEVTDGKWLDEEEAFQIDNFNFSALCILGDEVEPAFEDAEITAYSLDKESFKAEFSTMLSELKESLSREKEEDDMNLKDLLEKYNLTMEDVTAKGIKLDEISEDELEAKIVEAFEIDVEGEGDNPEAPEAPENENPEEPVEPEVTEPVADNEPEVTEPEVVEPEAVEPEVTEPEAEEPKVDVEALQAQIADLQATNEALNTEVEELREFKLNTEKEKHEDAVQKMFSDFQLTEEDVEGLDIHKFSVEEIEEKCFAIIGRKMAKKGKKSFSKEEGSIRIQIENESPNNDDELPYGGLVEKYKNK